MTSSKSGFSSTLPPRARADTLQAGAMLLLLQVRLKLLEPLRYSCPQLQVSPATSALNY
jgi:hypothetical protein